MEGCQRRKILNQTSFGVLLHEALTRLKLEHIDEIVQEAKQFFEPGGILYDEKATTKLSAKEKHAPLIAFLAGKGLKTVISDTGDLSASDEEVKLILQSKIGSAQHTKPEVKALFDRAEEITLKKLDLDTPEKAMRYYLSLDRTAAFVLQQAFKDQDFDQIRWPNLAELWNRTALIE